MGWNSNNIVQRKWSRVITFGYELFGSGSERIITLNILWPPLEALLWIISLLQLLGLCLNPFLPWVCIFLKHFLLIQLTFPLRYIGRLSLVRKFKLHHVCVLHPSILCPCVQLLTVVGKCHLCCSRSLFRSALPFVGTGTPAAHQSPTCAHHQYMAECHLSLPWISAYHCAPDPHHG